MISLYTYRAHVLEVYDGDTITVDIDLGLETWIRGVKVRLFGIDTPEVRGPERPDGLISRDWLRERILGKVIIIRTHKDKRGKYGRWLGTLFSHEAEQLSLNDQMVNLGLAEARTY